MQTLPRGNLARGFALILAVFLFFWAFPSIAQAGTLDCSQPAEKNPCGWAMGEGTISQLYNENGKLTTDYKDFGIGTGDAHASSLGVYFDICGCEILAGDQITTGYIQTNNCCNFGSTDRILLINLQGTHAGTYKILEVSRYESGKIYFAQPMTSSEASSFGTPGSEKIFFQEVPQYKNFNVDSDITWYAWKTGYPEDSISGVIALMVKDTLTLTNNIKANALGYIGGNALPGNSRYTEISYAGESINGPGSNASHSANNGGGGGGNCGASANKWETGGGGGGYGSAGVNGGYCLSTACNNPTQLAQLVGVGGAQYGGDLLSKLYLGSGGGAGGSYNSIEQGSDRVGGIGGTGGGAVIIFARNIQGSAGKIEATGDKGQDVGNAASCGGGGGSGGSVLVTTLPGTSFTTSRIDVTGGTAGTSTNQYGCNGGSGGNGRSFINTSPSRYPSGTYTSKIFDVTQYTSDYTIANWTNATLTGSASGIRFFYRVCNELDCSDKEFIECTSPNFQSNKCKNINQIGRYFQYNISLTGDSASVNSINIEYKNPDEAPPSVFNIDGAPSGWVNTKTTPLSAKIACQDNTGCDTNSFKIKKSSTKITCTTVPIKGPIPTDYSEASEQLDDGSYGIREITSQLWVCAAGSDSAGNFNYTKRPANFSIDNDDPTAAITNVSSSWIKSNELLLNCTDPAGGSGCIKDMYYSYVSSATDDCQSGGTKVTVTTSFPYKLTVTGIASSPVHNDFLCLRVSDAAGNPTEVSSQLMVDSGAPETTADSFSGWHPSPFTVNLHCSDQEPGSGCKKTYFCNVTCTSESNCPTTCSSWQTSTSADTSISIPCSQNCLRRVLFYSEDNAGNKEATTRQSDVVKIDSSYPGCTIKTPKTGGYTTTNEVMVTWNATSPAGASPLDSVVVARREGAAGDWDEGWSIQQGLSTQTIDGSKDDNSVTDATSYTYKCKARSQLPIEGSWGSDVTTTIRLNAPQVEITTPNPTDCPAPTGCWRNTTSIPLAWTANSGESGLKYTLFYKGGSISSYTAWSQLGQAAKSGDFGKNGVPIILENNKSYTFKAMVVDAAGLVQNSSEVTVKVDTVKPTCTVNPLPAYQSTDMFTASWTGRDGESGIDHYVLEERIGTDGLWTPVELTDPLATSYEASNAQDGAYFFRCYAVDRAGNSDTTIYKLTSSWKNTTVDLNAPELAREPSYLKSVNETGNMTIKATLTDAIRILNATLIYNNTEKKPNLVKNQTPNVWNVTWVIAIPLNQGTYNFTIKSTDVTGKVFISDVYEFNVVSCIPGDVIEGCQCGTGNKTCGADGNWGECLYATKTAKDEICNGEDDNCDGIIDNIGMPPGETATVDETKCACTGIKDPADITIIKAKPELCNGIDDNCNQISAVQDPIEYIDENGNCCDEGDTSTAECNNKGVCKGAMKTCTGGAWTACSKLPGEMDCGSSKDNDCNGMIDKQEPACTSPCIDNDGDGYGNPGSVKCTAGSAEKDCDDSDPTMYPGAEPTCNGPIKDNNCDGSTADETETCKNPPPPDTCKNGVKDTNEDDVDCGGDCPTACFQWGWLYLTAGGVVILLILVVVWLHFKRQGRELTWEELGKKWTPSE